MTERNTKTDSLIERRKTVVDRRLGLKGKNSQEQRQGYDRRRGPGVRLSPDRKAAEEGQMTDEQFDFLMAIDAYKRQNHRPFPTWTEVLEVVKALGYRKVADAGPIESTRKSPEPVNAS